ncbi:membrane protein containing DUF445, transmembrane [Candidatus Magnetoovum chiemensis]|nr:membrane protein containing DUF445, transmembrane [Candidatus Magnetoovum chiemensis]
MNTIWLIPVISAFIGWLTNFVAIRMLFRPHKAYKLGFISIQGLIPKRKEKIARKMAETVEGHLFSKEDITKVLAANNDNTFKDIISNKVDDLIQNKLFAFNPMIAAFINDSIKDKIKEVLVQELISTMPDIALKIETVLEEELSIQDVVYEKINDFDFIKLEQIILSIASRELKAIELWGAALGFLIGCLQVLIL